MLPKKSSKIDFASNDYLGFAKSKALHTRFCEKVQRVQQIGSTGSRLLTGNSLYCEQLEKRIAAYHNQERALLFSSGYTANLGLLSAIAGRDDYIVYDEKVHASIRDGITLSRARHFSFRHNDLNHLEIQIRRCRRPPYVVVESIYSTDGSRAPLQELAKLCAEHLIVDEAHATGVYGPGLVTTPVLARVHTFGKALGVQGACVTGSRRLIDYLITTSRPFIYSTALSMPQLVAIECAYDLLEKQKPFPFSSPILAIPMHQIPSSEEFDIRLLRYPTVPRGEECVRICFHTFNTQNEVDRLYEWLNHYRD
ncbi:MAG: 8-amino-7-oxononanoate synthase 2 [Chlamydiales bacterium]|nr:8-amino-7-oxononanoate synthase 2 [Chlamydiales bacterium]